MTDETDHSTPATPRRCARRRRRATRSSPPRPIEKGLLIVHTGKGKGKSTAAFGMVFRAIGHGMRVGVVQFVKGRWATGERKVLDEFPELVDHQRDGRGLHLGNAGPRARHRALPAPPGKRARR